MSAKVILKAKRAQPFFGRHPWVFAGAIERVEGAPADGAEVDLVSHGGNFVARGLFNSQSKIHVRLYSWEENVPLDEAFFRNRLATALRLRHDVLKLNGPDAGYRVCFSESDYLSGMVVDRYGDWLTVQFTALGIASRRETIVSALRELLNPKGIYLRTEKGVGKLEGVELHDQLLWGEPPPPDLSILENGMRFLVNLTEGQKTGYYLDQRDNRAAVARLAPGKRFLDAFCYSGGFGLHAARAGAAEVLCLDGSEPALELARRNAALNGLENVAFERVNVFNHLGTLATSGRKFDVVVLDPPKFARNRGAIPEALKGYRRLHQLALKLLAPDGVLVSCCCTGLITMLDLEEMLAQVAVEAKRDVQIVERRGPAPDHPVAVTCRESGYLKCLVSRVL
ncbi:Ribosomal RNA large subunit methyltransferase I [Gemmata obscuriglobus]|uniref:Class I SAM-dependent rRNA methyltransferase n=1 Tax=Gemmata obscuriglobus TaxID=114 RepID=A0A2Z3H627_9BACT|nr:class I SAM-dependent rRNA methyltransferase [Gemmata obscuriglobus]AWM41208.1 class I SAM-dependent rRNA methyltransferase [Gemmata obscuriglobus]QEG25450.1 Ribosomal RNA large subunit methyltransferase I [Gemmata obscuriglobus]VTR98615.1 23s rrna methyltransferase : PUA domain containing protein OS=Planctomyces brasiliensis (strain ATCC 49424 / DSM 5305 / JCM 21570 / NBRC 103401 / IFAM 1448) GN=Plabr_0269 PE=4 SV=1: Methyltrans_SAM [Gemmata obscuriglobus UQM 2246]